MTPCNKTSENFLLDEIFSKQLFTQLSIKQHQFNVSGEGKPCTLTHPALIKAEQKFLLSPQEFSKSENWKDWKIICYEYQSSELKIFDKVKQFNGWPHDIFKFLSQTPSEAIFHFEHLGSLYLHKNSTEDLSQSATTLRDVLLPLWLDYALSPELWGEAGKWTRFHEQFHTLFAKFGLLVEEDSPGYYPLTLNAAFLIEEGFFGRVTHKSFQFIPGWDFPLSGLKKLEEVLSRRQSCLF